MDLNPSASKIKPTIWQFWDNPAGRKTPKIVDACIETVKEFKGDFSHKVLDNKTMNDYSDLPGFIHDRLKNGQMHFAHFADLLRLNLLKNNGGVWMDATLFMTAPIPKYIVDEDFFVFLTDKLTHFPYSFMQNFFIRAEKDSYLNRAWYELCVAYWKNEIKDIDYFQHQLLFKALITHDKKARELFAKMPHVSEDETIQFVGDKQFDKFDKSEWKRIRKESFIQKISYKSGRHTIANPADYPDSFFEHLITGKL